MLLLVFFFLFICQICGFWTTNYRITKQMISRPYISLNDEPDSLEPPAFHDTSGSEDNITAFNDESLIPVNESIESKSISLENEDSESKVLSPAELNIIDSINNSENEIDDSCALLSHSLIEYTKYGTKRNINWNENINHFTPESNVTIKTRMKLQSSLRRFFHTCFIPSGDLSPEYYTFTFWRTSQRLASATCSVFGTQALLLALGIKQNKIGLAATITWVLKDALGKFSRIFWASKNGGRFDSDAKIWRFRSSLLFAAGNGLEILTYVFPSLFLLCAAGANALKQMAMLTSSATRNTIYKSFALSDNIGDITAKGESQIAVVDLLGMLLGVTLSKMLGASKGSLATLFLLLTVLDIYCIFREIKSVIFRSLNFERTRLVLNDIIEKIERNNTAFTAKNPLTPLQKVKAIINNNLKGMFHMITPNVNTMLSSSESSLLSSDLNSLSLNTSNFSENLPFESIKNSEKTFPFSYTRFTIINNILYHINKRIPTKIKYILKLIFELFYNPLPPPTTTTTAISPPTTNTNILPLSTVKNDQISSNNNIKETPQLLTLTPEKTALIESIFKPTKFSEANFKSWSNLQSNKEIFIKCSNIFKSENEKFLISLHVREVVGWMEAYLAEIGLDSTGLLRVVKGYPVILTPEILLHKNATQQDIFRALVQVYHILRHFEAVSEPTTADKAGAILQLTHPNITSTTTTNNNNNPPPDKNPILETIGLTSNMLSKLVENAYNFEKLHSNDILASLERNGWNINKFTYGAIRTRVEW